MNKQNIKKLFHQNNLAYILIPAFAALCLLPFISSATALLLGIATTLTAGNPYATHTRKLTSRCLAIAVIGLGAGMNLSVIGKVGAQGIVYTIAGIAFAFVIGHLLARFYKVEKDTSLLVTVGTAICGGSAIAAVAPVIRARDHEVSVALAIVFLLNALALIIFPFIGHRVGLDQHQFGLWCALAIHDTSSVIGAALQYGPQAVTTGTTVKLARALWIIPVALVIGWTRARQNKGDIAATGKAKRPWFILGFLAMAALVTFCPALIPAGHIVEAAAKRLLVLTLFLIGSNLTRETLKNVGRAPFLMGVTLWAIVAGTTLAAICAGFIR